MAAVPSGAAATAALRHVVSDVLRIHDVDPRPHERLFLMPSRPPTRRIVFVAAGGIAVALVILAAGAFGRQRTEAPAAAPPAIVENVARPGARVPGASLDQTIASLQARLADLPGDYVSWATLGLAYVQQARITVDPTYYGLADGALARSLEEGGDDNYLAYAGLSALASARHDFVSGREFAEQGLEINGFSAILYGALSDAQIQLGSYDEGFASIDRMVELSPDTASLTRVSYAAELGGDIDRATDLMQRALDDAPNASDRAFASFYLGELKFNAGDPNGALGDYNRAVEAAPDEPALLAGKAKAEAASGQVLTALDHYAEVVERAPDPSYVTAYGRLLESLGRDAEAQQQYDVVEATLALFAAEGVAPDAAPILFQAEHGDLDEALAQSEIGVEQRPFIAMYDARAWALHLAGRHDEALDAIQRALELGSPYASYHYHAGMIHRALGNEDRALEELQRAMEINPSFDPIDAPLAAEAIAELESAS